MSILKDLGTPIFYAEGMPAETARNRYALIVDGLLEKPVEPITFKEIEKMPFSSVNARLTSVSGWSVRADWQGVKFSDFFENLSLKPEASHVNFESFGGYSTSVAISDLMHPGALICYRINGEYLDQEYGGPVRTFIPHLWGYKSIKGLSRMTFTDHSIPGYWEERGYTDDAKIEPGMTRDINSGKLRKIGGGEVTEF